MMYHDKSIKQNISPGNNNVSLPVCAENNIVRNKGRDWKRVMSAIEKMEKNTVVQRMSPHKQLEFAHFAAAKRLHLKYYQ